MMKQGPLSGQTLGGKYLLGELLGKGGFGAVYKAQNQMLRRQQAVKVLLEEHFSEDKFRDRFLREAQTLAALDHANIVHVDDIGIEGSFIYLVMPYISGGTLQDILKARSGPLALEVAARYLEQVCLALGYAHAQGIAHLDLKPLNLLVHQDGRLLLSDFGLAHLMERGAIEGGTSLQFGSPLYMAPEHFEGQPTQRSDLYALGVILYQMLTGRHPFEASTPAAVMRKHLTEPPPPLHLARPDLPVALDAVIGKALAKQQEQRYERAGELLFDFRAALGGQLLRFAGSAEATRLSQPGTFAGPNDPTRLSQQMYHDPTVVTPPPPPALPSGLPGRASGPAVPPPPPPPSGPQYVMPAPLPYGSPGGPQVVYMPVQMYRPLPSKPKKPKGPIWTPGFTRLFVLTAIAGGVIMLYITLRFLLPRLYGGIFTLRVIEWMPLLVLVALTAVCVVGLRFMPSKLLRAGLRLQIGALASSLVIFALILHVDSPPYDPNFPYGWIEVYLPLILTVFNVASFVLLSYGIARWQGARDAGFSVLQVLVSGIVVYLISTIHPFDGIAYQAGSLVWCLYLGSAAALFAACSFLLRPACWKQYPIVTLLLGLGAALFVFQATGGFGFIGNWIVYGVFFLSWLLSLLGFLLLIQTERVRKQVQQAQPAQAVVK